jgi:hypothetical protein
MRVVPLLCCFRCVYILRAIPCLLCHSHAYHAITHLPCHSCIYHAIPASTMPFHAYYAIPMAYCAQHQTFQWECCKCCSGSGSGKWVLSFIVIYQFKHWSWQKQGQVQRSRCNLVQYGQNGMARWHGGMEWHGRHCPLMMPPWTVYNTPLQFSGLDLSTPSLPITHNTRLPPSPTYLIARRVALSVQWESKLHRGPQGACFPIGQ